MAKRTSLHGLWSSRLTFILAVTGSAVGLGNIWKFPYITGQNGGGAFVLVYLLCVAVIGLPTMMAEVMIGRRGRRNPVRTMSLLGEEEAGWGGWRFVGVLGVVIGMLILSFYSVVAGSALAYIGKSISGAFTDSDSVAISGIYAAHLANWPGMLFWHTLFMILTVGVVARGVQRGLESAVRILMPALFVLLLVLLVYGMSMGHFAEAVDYLFTPDWKSLTFDSVLIALGHAFFTLSVGMGAVMAYGAYLPPSTPIGSTSVAVVIGDTVIALLAGLAIFPIVFANGLDPASGPGLIFETLPNAFGSMSWGAVFGSLFFVLLTFAAWTSSIGLIEPGVVWLNESRKIPRPVSAVLLGLIVWLIGLATVFSDNLLKNVTFWKGTLYQNIDHLVSNILLPISGLLIIIFASWIMCRNSSAEALDIGTGLRYRTWRLLARYVVPIGILFVFVRAAGFFDGAGHG